jgi:hypothetical protein
MKWPFLLLLKGGPGAMLLCGISYTYVWLLAGCLQDHNWCGHGLMKSPFLQALRAMPCPNLAAVAAHF